MSLANAKITVVGAVVVVSAGSAHAVMPIHGHYPGLGLNVEQIGTSTLRVKGLQLPLGLDIQLMPDDNSDTIHEFLVRLLTCMDDARKNASAQNHGFLPPLNGPYFGQFGPQPVYAAPMHSTAPWARGSANNPNFQSEQTQPGGVEDPSDDAPTLRFNQHAWEQPGCNGSLATEDESTPTHEESYRGDAASWGIRVRDMTADEMAAVGNAFNASAVKEQPSDQS